MTKIFKSELSAVVVRFEGHLAEELAVVRREDGRHFRFPAKGRRIGERLVFQMSDEGGGIDTVRKEYVLYVWHTRRGPR